MINSNHTNLGTVLLFAIMHFAIMKKEEFYEFAWFPLSLIGTIYISEVCRISGKEYYNTCALVLFAYITGVSNNLSQEWRNSAIIVATSVVYYIARLGLHFSEFPVSFIAILIISSAFYLTNLIISEISQRKDKDLVQNLSQLSLSMCRLLDYLPYAVLIENQKEIIVYNK